MEQFNWNKAFQIIRNFSCPSPEINPEELLAADLGRELHTDRGLSVIELRNNIPHCIRWPDYANPYINSFNNHYCYIAPQIYNREQHIINPVNWSDYADTEYNRDFNLPLNIGYTTGFGVEDHELGKEIVFCLHKSIESSGFTPADLQLIVLMRPLIQNLFSMRKQLYSRYLEEVLPREISPGCSPLSSREREIMERLTGRESMREIALKLGISKRTVETHALHIYRKLCISSRNDLKRFLISRAFTTTPLKYTKIV
jgi:DNA-binding CsgD family transcriptional regulator